MKRKPANYSSKIIFATALSIFACTSSSAQNKSIKYEIESQTIGTTNGTVPFWMRSNQYGSIPLSGVSQSFIGRAYKDFSPPIIDSLNVKKKLIDWAFGFEGRANIGKGSNLQLIEGYGKVRIGVFNIIAGRSKNVMGLNGDTTLSSGNFAVSGNALGIPRVELSIPDYYRIPIVNGLFSIKGNFAHGWVGRQDINSNISKYRPTTYFHQKSLYVRIAKPEWKFKVYGAFNHQAYWGNEKQIYGENFKLSPGETFYYVFTGKRYGEFNIPGSKIGNQIGSIDIGLEYNFNRIKVILYRQNFYDAGALSKLANISDGLNGIVIENLNFNKQNNTFKWKKILMELFYSKDQAGYTWSTPTASGDEDYYNNYYYAKGWSYMDMNLGNPLITKKSDVKTGQASTNQYFINNRVAALNFGIEGSIVNWIFTTKLTYSKNYGTFTTSEYVNHSESIAPLETPLVFNTVKQFSFYLESMKDLKNALYTGFATSFDYGNLLNKSYGAVLKIKKYF